MKTRHSFTRQTAQTTPNSSISKPKQPVKQTTINALRNAVTVSTVTAANISSLSSSSSINSPAPSTSLDTPPSIEDNTPKLRRNNGSLDLKNTHTFEAICGQLEEINFGSDTELSEIHANDPE